MFAHTFTITQGHAVLQRVNTIANVYELYMFVFKFLLLIKFALFFLCILNSVCNKKVKSECIGFNSCDLNSCICTRMLHTDSAHTSIAGDPQRDVATINLFERKNHHPCIKMMFPLFL